jgi:predicted DNA-binding transcriptional regulator YafY
MSPQREYVLAMAESAARLLRMLSLLQRRPVWSGSELAERLQVEPRTVRRDVERLRSLGYRVDSAPGASGGYRLAGGADVPPLLFDDDEAMAVAVVLGVSAGAAVPGIERGALGALTKLDRLLPARLRTQLAALRAASVSLVSPATELVSAESLSGLARACDNHLRATFGYQRGDGQRTERRVEPYRLVATDRRWYLVAFDLDRDDWRTFRVDRATAVTVTGHTFVPRPLRDPAAIVAEGITTTGYAYRAVVRVAASPEETTQRIPPHVAVVRPAADGAGAMVELGVDSFDWLAGYLIGLGLAFEAVEPPAFRTHLAALGTQLAGVHADV